MFTYQDFLQEPNKLVSVRAAIAKHMASDEYKIAVDADLYDRQKNSTINQFVKVIQDYSGNPTVDANASNSRIASNFFRRLNTQLVSYLLGNGITFPEDSVKDKLGMDFDTRLSEWAYFARIHGVAFGYWNVNKLHVFKITEFVPLFDELTGIMRAGIRFWSLDWGHKPETVILYEEDGFTVYQTRGAAADGDLQEVQPKRGYQQIIGRTEADGEWLIGEQNYGSLPIVPLYGSNLKQSTLVGTKAAIDSYDMIQSGFANDLIDCAQIYWIIQNCGGMSREDLQQFLARLRIDHIATADTKSMGVESSSLQPYAQNIPYEARQTYLAQIRQQIYESFGALDTNGISAGAKTATEIMAAYENLDQEADALEYQVITAVRAILKLLNVDSVPQFKRNRISNQLEQVQMIMLEAQYLDDETILEQLPNITPDEIEAILQRKTIEAAERYVRQPETPQNAQEGVGME